MQTSATVPSGIYRKLSKYVIQILAPRRVTKESPKSCYEGNKAVQEINYIMLLQLVGYEKNAAGS
jgi:hypothetical protein